MIQLILLLLPLLTLSPATEPAAPSTSPASELTPAQRLRIAASRKSLALREIEALESRAHEETRRIVEAMDDLIRGRLTSLFEQHHDAVPGELEKVTLPPNIGRWRVAWMKLKASIPFVRKGEEELEDLCRQFIEAADRRIEPLREELMRQLDHEFRETLNRDFQAAQEQIRDAFQEVIIRHFPVWESVSLPPPPLPDQALPESLQSESGNVGLAGLAGLVTLILSRILKRLIPTLAAKMAGRVLAKLIPGIGAVLVGWEVWDAYQARTNLETELRTQFADAYRTEFTAQAIWTTAVDDGEAPYRDQVRQALHSSLTAWSAHCRNEAQRILDAAYVMMHSPGIEDYLEAQHQLGRHTEEVVEELSLAGEVFGPLVAGPPIEVFLEMQAGRDKRLLARLASELDEQLVTLYQRHGRRMLDAASAMGAGTFLAVVRSADPPDWEQCIDAFQSLPPDASDQARQGLLLLIQFDIDHRGVVPAALVTVARHATLFAFLAPELVDDRILLLDLLNDRHARAAIEDGRDRDEAATRVFLHAWDRITWHRYREQDRREALYQVVALRRERDGDEAIPQLAEALKERDRLTPIYMDVGREGILIWDAWVGSGAGALQEEWANRAIALFRKGYPADSLQTRQGIELVELCEKFPYVGPLAFDIVEPLGRAAKLVLVLLVLIPALLVLALAFRVFGRPIAGLCRLLRRSDRTSSSAGTS